MVYLNGKRSRISGGNKSSSFVLHTMPARAFTDVEIRARLVNKPILNSKPAAMTPVIHYYYPDIQAHVDYSCVIQPPIPKGYTNTSLLGPGQYWAPRYVGLTEKRELEDFEARASAMPRLMLSIKEFLFSEERAP